MCECRVVNLFIGIHVTSVTRLSRRVQRDQTCRRLKTAIIFLYLHSVFLATFMEYIHNIATKEILKYKVVLYNIRKINVNSCRNQSRFACFENFIHKDPFIRSLPSIRSSTTLWRPWGAIMLSYHVLVARSMSQTTLSN